MLRVAKGTANREIEFLAHNARFHCFEELCDRRGMDAETHAMTELAERLRQPFHRWHTVCLQTLRATLDGRFAEGERLTEEALEVGRLRQSEYATYVFRYAQMLAIRWAQGRLIPGRRPRQRDRRRPTSGRAKAPAASRSAGCGGFRR